MLTTEKLRQRSRMMPVLAALFGFAALLLMTGCAVEVQAEVKTLSGINAIRQQSGLPPLAPDAGLTSVARARSADMAALGYFGHNPPGGCNYVCIMDTQAVPHAYAGENIAWNTWDWAQTADVAVDMWHNSPPHMQNILNCHYERFGAGAVRARDGKVYFTMIFEGNRAC